jgi:hypothetical protein
MIAAAYALATSGELPAVGAHTADLNYTGILSVLTLVVFQLQALAPPAWHHPKGSAPYKQYSTPFQVCNTQLSVRRYRLCA